MQIHLYGKLSYDKDFVGCLQVQNNNKQKYLYTYYHFPIAASSINLGQMVGSLVGGMSGNKIGPKLTIMLTSVPAILGWLTICLAPNIHLLIAGNKDCKVKSLRLILY